MSTLAPAIDLDALLRRLHVPTVRRLYRDLVQRAEPDGLSYRNFTRRARGRGTRSSRPDPDPTLRSARAPGVSRSHAQAAADRGRGPPRTPDAQV
jgi:hypothetical protein